MEMESRQTASQGPKGSMACFFSLNKLYIERDQPCKGFLQLGPNCSHVTNRQVKLAQAWGKRPTLAKFRKQSRDIPT
eukprot:9193054-Karenia_brevis.AAC.1